MNLTTNPKIIGLEVEWRKGGEIGEKSCPEITFSKKIIKHNFNNKTNIFRENKTLREYPFSLDWVLSLLVLVF